MMCVCALGSEKFYDAREEKKQDLARKRKRLTDFGHDGTCKLPVYSFLCCVCTCVCLLGIRRKYNNLVS